MNYVDDHVDPDMQSGMFFVLYRLADRATDHSREDWTCFPSIETLAGDTHLSRSACERHLASLVMAGWISRKRRVRADGKLGIYDYTIHRTVERRAALQAVRAAIVAAGEKPAETLADLDSPHGKMQHGPCGDLGETMPQFAAQPCGELRQQEPSGEPKGEPSPRAREPGDEGFEVAVALWPDSGLRRTRWPAARASWAWACGSETAERLTEAVRRCAADPDRAAGDFGWPGFDVFLRDELWRGYLPRPVEPEFEAPRNQFAGPEDLRAAVAASEGEAFAGAYLDRSRWLDLSSLDGPDFAVMAWSGTAFDKLSEARVAAILTAHGVRVLRPGALSAQHPEPA